MPDDDPLCASAAGQDERVIDGRYVIKRRIGAGGMGEVFLARQLQVDREVALKLLPADRAQDERAVAQFLTETTAVSRLRSPHTVTLYDAGRMDDGAPYLAMELLEGMTLRQRLAQGPVGRAEALRIMDGICLSLAEAHTRGIVHRDLKPSNVFLAVTPGHVAQVKVLDFGLARLADAEAPNAKAAGTLRYMAPETLRGETVDARADVYALAMVAYELLAGHHPFEDHDREALIEAQLHEVPPPVSEHAPDALPGHVDKAIARGLAKAPRLRPPDAGQFRKTLRKAFNLPEQSFDLRTPDEIDRDHASALQAPVSETVVSRTIGEVERMSVPGVVPLKPRRTFVVMGAGLAVALAAGIYIRTPSPGIAPNGLSDLADTSSRPAPSLSDPAVPTVVSPTTARTVAASTPSASTSGAGSEPPALPRPVAAKPRRTMTPPPQPSAVTTAPPKIEHRVHDYLDD